MNYFYALQTMLCNKRGALEFLKTCQIMDMYSFTDKAIRKDYNDDNLH